MILVFFGMLGTCSHACMCERAYLFTRWHAYNTGLTPDPNAAVHVTRSESDARSNAIHAARAASSQPTEPVLGVACQFGKQSDRPCPEIPWNTCANHACAVPHETARSSSATETRRMDSVALAQPRAPFLCFAAHAERPHYLL